MEVVYKEIPGHRGYFAGSDGTIWSRLRGGNRKLTPHPLPRTRHLRVSLGGKAKFTVHSLVLLAFVGPCPEGMECRHFPDRNPSNNRLENLSWGTFKENAADRKAHGTDNIGARNGASKLTELDVIEIRRLYASGKCGSYRLGAMFGVRHSTILALIHRKTWKHC